MWRSNIFEGTSFSRGPLDLLRVGVFFADVRIETTGGATYLSKGFRKTDAQVIVELLTP